MRILFVADNLGGVRTFTAELTRELITRDIEVHLALIGPGGSSAPASTCAARDLRLEWMENPWADVERTAAWIDERRREVEPDLIHMNTFTPVCAPQTPVLLTVHSCVLTWWRAVHGCDAPPEWDRYRALVTTAVRHSHAIAAPTRALLHALEEIHGPLPHARVIHNGRDVGLGAPTTRGRESLVVSAGRLWDEAKNAALLASVAEEIEGHVVLIGPGKVKGAIEPLGQLSEHGVLRWLSRAAVFAEPARYEPFGLAALEAALCGCALVLGDIPSLREVWGGAATYVDPEDGEALVAEINALLRDPLRRAAVARRAYEVARRYHPVAMADRYVAAYRALVPEAVTA